MINSEKIVINGIELVHTYSDNPNKILLQKETGAVYKDAYDNINVHFTYIEIDEPTKLESEEETNE